MSKRLVSLAVLLILAASQPSFAADRPISTDGTDPKTWDARMDGPLAAPANHKVVFENDNIRIISVEVAPGASEPYHTHLKCAVLVFDQPVKVTDRDVKRRVETGDPVVWGAIAWLGNAVPKSIPFVWLQPPEAAHSITNNDTRTLHLTRIEMKRGCEAPPR
jgi:quercetin dioxygenase-like cupin family protein